MMLNYTAIVLASVLEFAFGAIWYGPLFGKIWGKIHGFDKLPKEVQEKMMKMMGPTYAIQFLVTVVTTIVLAIFMANQPAWNAYAMAGIFWLGFVVPAQVSAVMFGRDEKKWMVKKVILQAGASLACLEIAVVVLGMM
ncbi:DUF1761 domain-containing protein [Candidatus Shapirobacteria bacterium]|nr:DUF1761 domain-containing protein [Candidatus Shapirobacteria bacterium]